MTHIISTLARVKGVNEHKRLVGTRKDPLDPQVVLMSEVSLGYFIHLDFGPESGPISFGVGPELPSVSIGDTVVITIRKHLE